MGNNAQKVSNLGTPKGESFGTAFRAAIELEFGTNKAFSRALGVSEGRVSQLIKGPDEVNPQSLGKVIAAFSSLGLQERIHNAWIREFIPLPGLDGGSSSSDILEHIKVVGKDLSPRRAIKIATQRRKLESDPDLRRRLLERIIQLYQRLDETAPALRGAVTLETEARDRNEPLDLISALWMRGNVLRSIDQVPPQLLLDSHQAAIAYADAVKPRGGPRLTIWNVRRFELERDFALQVLKANSTMPVGDAMLYAAFDAVQRSIDAETSQSSIYIGLEVRARVEIALGRLSDAEDTLDDVVRLSRIDGAELTEKISITRATLMRKLGEAEESEKILRRIVRKCLEEENLHHFRVADATLTQLLLAQ